MRTISIRQPWCFAILNCGKRIENRRTNIAGAYRGPVLLHAAKSNDLPDTIAAFEWMRERRLWSAPDMLPAMDRGGIVGRARIEAVFDPCSEDDYRSIITLRQPYHETNLLWAEPGMWWILLADVEPLPFVPCRGRLGLWTPLEDVVRAATGGAA